MKKWLVLIGAVVLAFGLSACGSNGSSADSKKGDNKQNNSKQTKQGDGKSSAEKQQDWVDKQKQQTKAKVIDSKYYKWKDESVGEKVMNVYAEIKNTGETTIDAGDAKVTFLDSDGSVISSTSEDGDVMPVTIKKGDTGYVSMDIDDPDEYKDLDKVKVKLSPKPAQDDGDPTNLKAKNVNMKKLDNWGKNSAVKVTGFLENNSDNDFDKESTEVVAGLYDKDDNFLAAQSVYQGQEVSVDANDESSFEVGDGVPLPSEVVSNVDHVKVVATGTDYGDDEDW